MRRRRAGWVTDWIRNSRGATLVEILASLVIIVLAAAASGAFFTSQVGVIRGLTKGSACKTAVESQMAIFERASSVAIAMPWRTQNPTGGPLLVDVKGAFPPVGAGKASNALPFSDPWLDDSLRLNINTAAGKHPITSTQLLPGTPGNYILDTVHLQRGTMALITSLYNGVPGICNGPILMSSIPQKVPAFQPDPLLLKNFDSTIQIEPIDLKTGGLVACSTYYPRPQPVMIDGAGQMTGKHTAISPNQIIGFQPDFSTRSDIGFRVTIRGQYDEFSGATKSCGVTQDFQYPVDSRPQSPSVILNAIGKGLPAGSVEPPDAFAPSRIKKQDAQANADAKLILEIGFKNPATPTDPGQPLDPGTVFMCRDRSTQLNPNYCPGRGKGGTPTVAGATMNGAPSAPANSPWVPCDQVTVCGIAPQTASSFFSQPAPNEAKYTNVYTNAGRSDDGLWGCDVRVDVATIDMSGNFTLLSERTHPNGFSADYALKYFQPSECWNCYQKKKRSLFSIIITVLAVAVSFGLIGLAIGCAVGLCKTPKGYTWKYRSATNDPPSRGFCRKVQPTLPPWWNASGGPTTPSAPNCPVTTWNYLADKPDVPDSSGASPPKTFTMPGGAPDGVSGAMYESDYIDPIGATFCEAYAICDGGAWKPLPVTDEPTQLSTCGKFYTRKRFTASSYAGSSTAGTPVCYLPIDNKASSLPMKISDYSPYQVCHQSSGAVIMCIPGTKTMYDAAGNPYSVPDYDHPIGYPPDPDTGNPNANTSGPYDYFEWVAPLNISIPECP